MQAKRLIAGTALGLMVVTGVTACSSYDDNRGKGDAPVANKSGEDSPATVTNFPDGFGNVATKCLAGVPGKRVVVTTNTSGPSNIKVIDDTKNC